MKKKKFVIISGISEISFILVKLMSINFVISLFKLIWTYWGPFVNTWTSWEIKAPGALALVHKLMFLDIELIIGMPVATTEASSYTC